MGTDADAEADTNASTDVDAGADGVEPVCIELVGTDLIIEGVDSGTWGGAAEDGLQHGG
jgi:hypothetical protein